MGAVALYKLALNALLFLLVKEVEGSWVEKGQE